MIGGSFLGEMTQHYKPRLYGAGPHWDIPVDSWHRVLLGTNLDLNWSTKPRGTEKKNADQSDGKLTVPNPLMTGLGRAPNSYPLWGSDGHYWNTAEYRNKTRQIHEQLRGHTTHPRLTGERETRTPFPTPAVLFWDYRLVHEN